MGLIRRMGERSCNEPLLRAVITAVRRCAIVRIFFRETGMPVHTGKSKGIVFPAQNPQRVDLSAASSEVHLLWLHALTAVTDQ